MRARERGFCSHAPPVSLSVIVRSGWCRRWPTCLCPLTTTHHHSPPLLTAHLVRLRCPHRSHLTFISIGFPNTLITELAPILARMHLDARPQRVEYVQFNSSLVVSHWHSSQLITAGNTPLTYFKMIQFLEGRVCFHAGDHQAAPHHYPCLG